MLVLVGDLDHQVIAASPRVAERIRAVLMAASLDRQLASGVPPEAGVCLALRAERLVRPSTRRRLSVSLRRIVREAARPDARHAGPLTPAARRRIRAAAEPIETVASQLQRPAPVSSCGVAQVCVLLCDGAGPLHGSGTVGDLIDRLRRAQGALEPLEGWDPPAQPWR